MVVVVQLRTYPCPTSAAADLAGAAATRIYAHGVLTTTLFCVCAARANAVRKCLATLLPAPCAARAYQVPAATSVQELLAVPVLRRQRLVVDCAHGVPPSLVAELMKLVRVAVDLVGCVHVPLPTRAALTWALQTTAAAAPPLEECLQRVYAECQWAKRVAASTKPLHPWLQATAWAGANSGSNGNDTCALIVLNDKQARIVRVVVAKIERELSMRMAFPVAVVTLDAVTTAPTRLLVMEMQTAQRVSAADWLRVLAYADASARLVLVGSAAMMTEPLPTLLPFLNKT